MTGAGPVPQMRYRTLWLLRKSDRRKGLSGMSSGGKTDLHHMIKGILWGVLIGEAVTVLLLLIFALAMTAASLPPCGADWLSAAGFLYGRTCRRIYSLDYRKRKRAFDGTSLRYRADGNYIFDWHYFFKDRYFSLPAC